MVAWHFNTNGQFTIRSAYKVFLEDRKRNKQDSLGGSASGTASRVPEPFWKHLWNLDCPKKMLHFLRRLGRNSLALRVNLRRSGMNLETKCVMCDHFDEDGAHLSFKCKEVTHIWAELQLENVRQKLAGLSSVREVIEAIFTLDQKTQRIVIILLYIWWSECGGITPIPSQPVLGQPSKDGPAHKTKTDWPLRPGRIPGGYLGVTCHAR
jgi:hypothetical protein